MSQRLNPCLPPYEELMKELTKEIIDAFIGGYWQCPECRGKPLGRLCMTCCFFDGVPLKEIVENNWSTEQVKQVIDKRKKN